MRSVCNQTPLAPSLQGTCRQIFGYAQVCQLDARLLYQARLYDVQEQLEDTMSEAVNTAVQQRLTEAGQQRAAGDAHWWRLREAALFAVGTQVTLLSSMESSGVPAGLHVRTVLKDVLQNDLIPDNVPPFLRGRALWVAAQLGRGLPQSKAASFLQPAVAGLGAGNPVPVRVCACRAVAQLFKMCGAGASAPHVQQAMQALVELMRTVDQDVLLLVMETCEVRLARWSQCDAVTQHAA
jgi:importin-9